MYGCLGFSSSRFHAKAIAALITKTGRSTLLKTKDIAENKLQFNVVYGDTDSIMINTGTNQIN
jgi:DNA polymerase alpha subunit A